MDNFDDSEIISKYTVQQAIEDGVLVEVFKKRWKELSGGKPIVATAHIYEEISLAGLLEIWNEFVANKKHLEENGILDQGIFATLMNGEQIWVIEDSAAFTIMYPEDY